MGFYLNKSSKKSIMSIKKTILSWSKTLIFTMAIAYFFLFVTSCAVAIPLITLHYTGKQYLDDYMVSFAFISLFTAVGFVLSCLNLNQGVTSKYSIPYACFSFCSVVSFLVLIMGVFYLKINSGSMLADMEIDYNIFLHDDWKGHWMVKTASDVSPNSDFMGFLDQDLVKLVLELFDSMISVVVSVSAALTIITSLSIYTTLQKAYSVEQSKKEVEYA